MCFRRRGMSRRAICLQHVSFEGPGAFASLLAQHGYTVHTRLVPQDGVPDSPGDVLLIMGGPMSVNDSDSWIAAEMEFIARAMEAGIPVLGVCLGSQLMARALGARVYPGREPEIGMVPIAVTPAGRQDPVFRSMPDPFEVFEWHGEVFDLPPGAVALASSDLCPIQAFRFGEKSYGLLFHAEIEPSGIEALCRECGADLQRAGVDAEHLLRRAAPHVPRLHAWAEKLIAHLVAG